SDLDTDGDGQVSLEEWRAAGKSIEAFQRIDRNDDGILTPDEVLYSLGLPADGAKGGKDSAKKGPVMGKGKLSRDLPAWFAKLDTDGDGQVSLDEWREGGKALEEFEAMDRNGDGYLTADEVLHYIESRTKAGGKWR